MAKIVSSNVGALRTARRELITLRLTIKELAARVKAEKLEAAEAKRTANRKAGAVTVTKGA